MKRCRKQKKNVDLKTTTRLHSNLVVEMTSQADTRLYTVTSRVRREGSTGPFLSLFQIIGNDYVDND